MKAFDNKEIGNLIAKYRALKGWSQRQLAEESGLKKNYIGQVERGEINAHIEKIIAIADALEIGLDDLLCDFLSYAVPFDISDSRNKLLNEIRFSDTRSLADILAIIDGYIKAKGMK